MERRRGATARAFAEAAELRDRIRALRERLVTLPE
jgi:protein-arginine kinase activator protein McsA